MDQPLPVGVVERFADLPDQPECLRHGERALAGEPVAQRLAFHVGHDVVGAGRRLVAGAGIEQGENVGVLEPGEDLDLKQKALRPRPDEDLGTQDLDRDRAVVLPVASEVHYRHAAPAQQSVDRVTVAQRERLQDGLVTAILHGGKLIPRRVTNVSRRLPGRRPL